ncbi:hypothetical protein A6M23_09690 [Acidithiobacillus thiooxidans]|uniref:Uncharacterized protein n=2 Tax=Acidithiobacillus thiooxidans TaxID=930 RepID=A0A1C2JBS3_ACITH|nr:hypothetical protein A6M23_09690 [Acidithiobacillus thiooxidans]OCX85687.1 hypothetical protein A6P08_07470 [Acidithiobacillus thiooxidans]
MKSSESIKIKVGLVTFCILIAAVIAIIALAFILLGIIYGLALIFGFSHSLNHIMYILMIAAFVSPFFFFVGWASYDLVHDLYAEVAAFMDTRRGQR